jgi:hypothetical protein
MGIATVLVTYGAVFLLDDSIRYAKQYCPYGESHGVLHAIPGCALPRHVEAAPFVLALGAGGMTILGLVKRYNTR